MASYDKGHHLGNFPNYYDFNPVEQRTSLLAAEVLAPWAKSSAALAAAAGRPLRLLDLGCNSGDLTVAVRDLITGLVQDGGVSDASGASGANDKGGDEDGAREPPVVALGVDIDGELIEQAAAAYSTTPSTTTMTTTTTTTDADLAHLPSRVRQTDFSAGRGNALQACVASLVGVPLTEVPNFVAMECGYARGIADFASSRGMTMRKVPLPPAPAAAADVDPPPADPSPAASGAAHAASAAGANGDTGKTSISKSDVGRLCLLRGKSPRGAHGHVVLARLETASASSASSSFHTYHFSMVHDPHPDDSFLAPEAEEPYGWAMFLDGQGTDAGTSDTTAGGRAVSSKAVATATSVLDSAAAPAAAAAAGAGAGAAATGAKASTPSPVQRQLTALFLAANACDAEAPPLLSPAVVESRDSAATTTTTSDGAPAAGTAAGVDGVVPDDLRRTFLQTWYSPAGDGVEATSAPAGAGCFDLVSCFGMTMWVHVNQGDEGLRGFLRRMARAVAPGGCLVLETHPWKCYKSARARLRRQKLPPPPHYGTITYRNDVEEYVDGFMRGDECGLSQVVHLGTTVWGRTIKVYARPDAKLGALSAGSTASGDASGGGGAAKEEEEEGKAAAAV